jgi:hypothetical protein
MLRVGNLTTPDTADSLTGQLAASLDSIGQWLRGACELLRADGACVRVRFAVLRKDGGELAVRFESMDDAPVEIAHPHAVLEAWRRQELALQQTEADTLDHRAAQLEALWLAAEYQRLVGDRLHLPS